MDATHWRAAVDVGGVGGEGDDDESGLQLLHPRTHLHKTELTGGRGGRVFNDREMITQST